MADRYELRLPCLRVTQGARPLYSFAVDGKRIHDFATVARVGRGNDAAIAGYQRPEVIKHVKGIQRYLEKPGALLPNAVVVAFDERVRFEPTESAEPDQPSYVCAGTLVIPVDEAAHDGDKPGWIVDGQQRSAALRDARLDSFPVCVVSFIADEAEQRAQFILVNHSRPLPKGLIHELLPATKAELPTQLMRRRFAAGILQRLNTDHDSPFRGRIATTTHPEGLIKDNAVLRMIENSIYNGALYTYRDPESGEGDVASMLAHLKIYWTTVATLFTEAWSLPPRYSRLTHGVGIAALGFVMDQLTDGVALKEVSKRSAAINALKDAPWTQGVWEMAQGPRRWNSLQNTPNDIRLLTAHLIQLVEPPRESRPARRGGREQAGRQRGRDDARPSG